MKVWFARPIPLMGTSQDRKHLRLISEQYPGATVEFASLRECTSKKKDKDMDHFLARVDDSDVVVVAEVSKGTLSSGVFAEAQHARHQKIPVKVIRDGTLVSVRNLEVTGKDQRTDWAKVTTY